MKSKSVFSKKLLGVVIILSTTLLSCVINDTNDDSTPSVMDTTATKLDNPPATSTQSSMSDNPANTVVATGKAIPNPAKKGMKGKVTVIETATSKPVANMEADVNGIYSNVEIIPSFPGGYKGLQKFFDDNLEYPADATNDGVEGTVSVSFVGHGGAHRTPRASA